MVKLYEVEKAVYILWPCLNKEGRFPEDTLNPAFLLWSLDARNNYWVKYNIVYPGILKERN